MREFRLVDDICSPNLSCLPCKYIGIRFDGDLCREKKVLEVYGVLFKNQVGFLYILNNNI